jgi:hypothetical protein
MTQSKPDAQRVSLSVLSSVTFSQSYNFHFDSVIKVPGLQVIFLNHPLHMYLLGSLLRTVEQCSITL